MVRGSSNKSDNGQEEESQNLINEELNNHDDDETSQSVEFKSSEKTKNKREKSPVSNIDQSSSHGVNRSLEESSKDTDETSKYPDVSYFRLFRFSNRCEKFVLVFAVCIAACSGIIPSLANKSFGVFTKAMVEKGSNITKCPPDPSSPTSPFMKVVETFVILQCSFAAAAFILGYLFVMCMNSVAENQVYKIRKKYFEKLLRQDISWFDKNSKRDFSSRLVEDMLKIQDAVSEKLGMIVVYIANSIFLLILAFISGWKLSAALVTFIPILGLVTAFNSSVSSKMAEKEQNAYSEAGAVAEEVLTNIRTVNAFNGQEKELARYDEKVIKAKNAAIHKHLLVGLGNGLVWSIYYINFAFAFWYGTELILKSRETGDGLYGPDNILVIFFSVLMAGFYIGDSSQYFQAISEGCGSAKGIFPVLDRVSEIDSMSLEGTIPQPRARGLIEFENVEFSYPTRPTEKILKNLSITIQPGQTVAFVGTSGCGKSTCISLLQRFYDVTSGTVKVDGVNVKELNINWLRSQCGSVGQEPVLFNATIAENIAFSAENVPREEIFKVAEIAYAHDFISQLPLGYETLAGERGTQISGGQKQRIAIARALIRNPPILLLDEATSSLDFTSEAIVQKALERAKQGRTTIIVAHRLSTIKSADVVIVIDKGEVKERGTHNELMELKGMYYHLVMSQEDKEEVTLNAEEFLEEEREMRDTVVQDMSETYPRSSSGQGRTSPSSRARLISVGSLDETTKVDYENVEVVPPLKKGTIWRLWKMNFQEWPYLGMVVICSILKGLHLPLYAYIFGRFIQIFTLKDDFEIKAEGDFFALIYTIIAVLVGIDGFFQNLFVGICGEKFTYRIRKIVFSNILGQDITFFDEAENTVGNLCARLSTDATSLRGLTGTRLCGVIQALTILLAASTMAFILIPKMSAVTILFVPVMIYGAFLEGKVLGSDNVVEKESIEKSCNLAVEALSNIRTVASLCAERKFIQRYHDFLEDSHRINKRRAHLRGVVYGFTYAASYLCYALSVFYGSYLVEHECETIGNVFSCAEALIFCTTSGGAAMALAPDYDKGKIAALRIFKLLDRGPLISRLSTNRTLESTEGKLEMKSVNFYYQNRPSVRVLRNMDLIAKPGANVALVGPSGSGKSTCAALILRLYDPTSGELKFDDVDIKSLSLDFLRQQIAIVSQEPILFDFSIAQNIAYGDNSRVVPMDEIIKASRMANIHDFISSLPAGYETRVGSLGNQLSGGQKQRVAIARALVRSPKLLVMDEASSALDSESERVVLDALNAASEGRTCITIAHRLSSIQNSDQIIVMKNGCVREVGTHGELIRVEGLYKEMWSAQKLQIDSH